MSLLDKYQHLSAEQCRTKLKRGEFAEEEKDIKAMVRAITLRAGSHSHHFHFPRSTQKIKRRLAYPQPQLAATAKAQGSSACGRPSRPPSGMEVKAAPFRNALAASGLGQSATPPSRWIRRACHTRRSWQRVLRTGWDWSSSKFNAAQQAHTCTHASDHSAAPTIARCFG
ncbi:hypothetical protein IE81DRAFT_161582 [Ceraceosorus guamensis]|uniref:Uncharacterized protein n=1 Tax=Ceraceosorus guamensis TaxID=1522189 RepID=A0A316W6M7_9BASI|nr:hypothetical protein IE81DRAFT_161582 [Ceraceosorus guamensis]PWN45560.1 hypothetical protein IE81DRAFT_161582 [Ceraceosorus guamensis]